mgnify:CR=1 FL=1
MHWLMRIPNDCVRTDGKGRSVFLPRDGRLAFLFAASAHGGTRDLGAAPRRNVSPRPIATPLGSGTSGNVGCARGRASMRSGFTVIVAQKFPQVGRPSHMTVLATLALVNTD